MTTKIHSTAIIDKNAEIHESVEVGAYAVIGPHVVIGENSRVAHHASIVGHTTIGKNNKIYQFASIGEAPQDKKYKDEPTQLVIGNDNNIREFTTLNTGTIGGGSVTTVGSNNMIMAYVHVAHDCHVGNNIVLANSVALAGHVTVRDWAILGGAVAVHQFSIIGEHAMVAGMTGVSQDVPPYVMAFGYRAEPKGINVEGLKRRGFSVSQIENIKQAYKILYRNGLGYNEAKEFIIDLALEQQELQVLVEFFKASTRGMIR